MAKIQLNGKKIQLNGAISIENLLKKYKINKNKVAIELNGTIISKLNLRKKIKNNDQIEIVHFIGGG